ncbi:hypothetical protein TCDM_11788 [Trypanosoma cruzi Dm28c]|uniref:Uncharacterized protein n=1 Tax=Trypanosoma cruzi Dm28c TaxID=1416333 RepID=V5AZI7_TRYCR|nr:hypothetical protein TCDM_11788 [Trypanosoma cruzi Dm28c]
MHIYNGHIIVCASWGEARTRVHARGHTHREKDECVCGRCTALSHSLSRGHHRSSSRTRNKKKKQKRGGGVGDSGAAVTVANVCLFIYHSGRFEWCFFLRFRFFIFTLLCSFGRCTTSG